MTSDRKVIQFCDNLRRLGVTLRIDGERIVAEGAGVSPVLQAEVDKRAAAIVRLAREQRSAGARC